MSRSFPISVLMFVLLTAASCSRCGAPEISTPRAPAAEVRRPLSLPGLDPERSAILRLSTGPSEMGQHALLREDLQELVLAQGYQVVPAGSAGAAALASACVGWSIQIDLGGEEAGNSQATFAVFRHGEPIVRSLRPASRPQMDEAARYWRVRHELAAVLDRSERTLPSSLGDAESAAFGARMEAMQLVAGGRLGAAAGILQRPGLGLERDAALSFRLGRILAAWGSDMLATSRAPLWGDAKITGPLEKEAEDLLARAQAHLDRAIELDPQAPMAFFDRGKVLELLGESGPAERDYRQAQELWPAYSEAVAALARLRLARNDLAGLGAGLEASLLLADPAMPDARGALLANLGKVQLHQGEAAAAASSFEEVLAQMPVERRLQRVEMLGLLAQAQRESANSKLPATETRLKFGLAGK